MAALQHDAQSFQFLPLDGSLNALAMELEALITSVLYDCYVFCSPAVDDIPEHPDFLPHPVLLSTLAQRGGQYLSDSDHSMFHYTGVKKYKMDASLGLVELNYTYNILVYRVIVTYAK